MVEQKWRRVVGREFVGEERTHLAGLLGIPIETFRGLLTPSRERQRRPRLGDALAALARCQSPLSAFNAVLEPLGLAVIPTEERDGDPAETARAMASGLAKLLDALEDDGAVDHLEWPDVRPLLDRAEDAIRRMRCTMNKRHGT